MIFITIPSYLGYQINKISKFFESVKRAIIQMFRILASS